MNITNISGIHTITKLAVANTDYLVAPHTGSSEITTIQSIILKAPKDKPLEFSIKTQRLGGTRESIMDVIVHEGSTKIINVKQQLPESVGMYVSAKGTDGTVTVNGITIKLG